MSKKSIEEIVSEYFSDATVPLHTREVMHRLNGLSIQRAKATDPEQGTTKITAKSKMSPEARKRISEAAKKRWAPKPIQQMSLPEAGD